MKIRVDLGNNSYYFSNLHSMYDFVSDINSTLEEYDFMQLIKLSFIEEESATILFEIDW